MQLVYLLLLLLREFRVPSPSRGLGSQAIP
jgi:hypothetical protein